MTKLDDLVHERCGIVQKAFCSNVCERERERGRGQFVIQFRISAAAYTKRNHRAVVNTQVSPSTQENMFILECMLSLMSLSRLAKAGGLGEARFSAREAKGESES